MPSEPSHKDAKNTEPASVPSEPPHKDAKNTEPAPVPSEPSQKDAKNTAPAPVPSEPSHTDAKNTEPAPVPSEPSNDTMTIKAVRRKAQEEKARQGLKILQAKSDSLSDCRPRKEALLELDAATFKQLTLV